MIYHYLHCNRKKGVKRDEINMYVDGGEWMRGIGEDAWDCEGWNDAWEV